MLPAIDPREPFDPSKFVLCANPMRSPASDEAVMRGTLAMLEKFNVRRAVTSGPAADVRTWRSASPRVIPAIGFGSYQPSRVAELRRLHGENAFAVFGEITAQYRGIRLDDERLTPFFALAEELDIPVGVHLGEGPPATSRFPGYETYRVALSSPLQLEAVLVRHPKLRIWVMHYGSPFVDEMIAMMFAYPHLYVDVSANNWGMRRAQFHDHLKRMVDAGFEKRIMFGSDQIVWPEAIPKGIAAIEEAPFLTESQKRDIFYNNAARFLRLSREEVARDHRGAGID